MTFLEAVKAVQRACSETELSSTVGATGLDNKFKQMMLEAYRLSNTWKRWPWTREMTSVSATASPSYYTLDTSVSEIIYVAYNNAVLSDKYTFEDLQRLVGGSAATGTPSHAAQQLDTQIFVYPEPTDANPETLIDVFAYTVIADPAADATALEGPDQYQDAVVHLAYAIAQDKHFGDKEGAKESREEAKRMLQRVWSKARKFRAAPRIRV